MKISGVILKKRLLFVLIIVSFSMLFSTIINIPADYGAIQTGINAAVNGDTIFVQPGTYLENIDFSGKNIVICSNYLFLQNVEDIENTIIDGGQNGTVVKFANNEDSTALIMGFSIINGQAAMGGGIYCNSSTPVIQYNIIRDNIANFGGGIFSNNSEPQIINNTIVNNSGYGLRSVNSNIDLHNCIFWNNTPEQIQVNDFDEINAIYNDIESGWEGIGNIDLDPLFENTGNSEFQLGQNSPCKNTGNPHSICDSDGTRIDMGALFCTNSDIELFADILVDVNTGYCPIEIQFYDYSEAFNTEITSWFWQFGNESTSTAVNPVHTYSNPGVYTVSLIVSDETGNDDSIILEDLILVFPEEYNGEILHISLDGSDLIGNGSEEYPFATIQYAIDSAENGKTLIVSPGTYYENLSIYSKEITLGSLFILSNDVTYIQNTIIDGSQNGSTISICTSTDNNCTIKGLTITNGKNQNGGGLNIISSNIILENLIVSYNEAFANGGFSRGGGIYIASSFAEITNCKISNNISTNNPTYPQGGGIFFDSDTYFLINNSLVNENQALWGGGIYCQQSNGLVTNSTILANQAFVNGAGVGINNQSNIDFLNSVIVENVAGGFGGGIALWTYSDFNVYNCTIAENLASWGGALYCYNGSGTISEIINSVLFNNQPEEIFFIDDGAENGINIFYSLISGGLENIETNNNGTVNWGEGNIDFNPEFGGSDEHPYSILEDSPCIDSGIPDTTGLNLPFWDILGNERVWDGDNDGITIIDMGAYEFDAPLFVGIEPDHLITKPTVYSLRNYPNPFNPKTTISFFIPEESKVELIVFNIKGQNVKTLINNQYSKGNHLIIWSGDDNTGNLVSSGVYLYKLNVDGNTQAVKRCLLLK
ncbi:MAG: T9SS type A sorting domain-containing protein [Candidatus Cloacimonetes bacterium]|nr:T9SS type A sorting domain-containing protein [Candidatus Cloacimonadota bacterium]